MLEWEDNNEGTDTNEEINGLEDEKTNKKNNTSLSGIPEEIP